METLLGNILTRISEKLTPRKETPPRLNDQEANRLINQTIDVRNLEARVNKPFEDTQIESLARLTLELGDRLEQYDTILSDDASGRLVTLLLKNIADRKRKEKGQNPTRVFFVAGGHYEKEEKKPAKNAVEEFIASKREELGKTLLVTEHIFSGKSIMLLINILENQGVDFDVAAVSILSRPYSTEDTYDYRLTKRLYYGSIGNAGYYMYGQRLQAGVHKTIKGQTQAHPVKHEQYDPALVKQAREDVKLLGGELYKLISY